MSDLDLFLFSTDPALVRTVSDAGAAGAIVDWEVQEKSRRQSGADTEVNVETLEDLHRVRSACGGTLICRINGLWDETGAEVDKAVGAGADEILLPMVRTVAEVEQVLRLADGRCGVGILVETADAVRIAPALARLPLARVYVGLNDLAIDRRLSNIFVTLVDGTIERVREPFDVPFGVAGLTLPDLGSPVPCSLLMAEMVRLDCSFAVLRRSFRRDVVGRDPSRAIREILSAMASIRKTAKGQLDSSYRELTALVTSYVPASAR